MSVTRRPKRFLRFLYLSETILKRLTQAMTGSAGTRSVEMVRLCRLSSLFSGFFLLRFFGIAVLLCSFCRPM